MKSAKQMRREQDKAARELPTETKRKFWKAMLKENKSLGEASRIAGIGDTMVAAALVIQCHKTLHLPMAIEEIK